MLGAPLFGWHRHTLAPFAGYVKQRIAKQSAPSGVHGATPSMPGVVAGLLLQRPRLGGLLLHELDVLGVRLQRNGGEF